MLGYPNVVPISNRRAEAPPMSSSTGQKTSGVSDAIAARALEPRPLIWLGRAGWVAKGVVYGLAGVLAVPIAFGEKSRDASTGGSGEASQTGAVEAVAEAPAGSFLLVALAVGLVLYALWRLTTALLPGENDLDTWAHRAAYLGSAALYGFLAWVAISFVIGGGSSGSSGGGGDGIEKASRMLIEQPGGRWLLGIAAIVGLGSGAYFVYKGLAKTFLEQIDLAGAHRAERTFIEQSGRLGWIGRAVTVGLVSLFVLLAAIGADPDEAKGLDSALRDTADDTVGATLVLLAGLGLVVYGVFAAVSARRRRLVGP